MGAERDIINAVGRNVRTIIKWTGLGLFQIGFWFGGGFGAGKVIIPCYDNFCASLGPLPIKKTFPCQLCQLFWSGCSLVVPSGFRCSNPRQLSNQHRLVHGALAPHHLAIIAKSLHNVGLLESIFALISPPASWIIYCQQAQQKCDNVKLSEGRKYNESASSGKLKCRQTDRPTQKKLDLMQYINNTYCCKHIASSLNILESDTTRL